MKKHLLLIAFIGFAFNAASAQEKIKLNFDKEGKFKIAQFTDMHWINGSPKTATTVSTIKYVLETEKPDVAILTGDQVIDEPSREVWPQIAKIFEDARMPFAVVMGNHDAETGLTREEIFDILSRSPYFIGEKGPDNIHGCGNYVVPVENSTASKLAALLYCIDANDYTTNSKYGKYAPIHYDQITWYREQSEKFTKANNNVPLPALAFFHIPLPEYREILGLHTTIGHRGEDEGYSKINTGMLSSIIDMKDVMGVFAGHDHNNDYIGIKFDIALAYGRATGADAYGELERGSRIIELYENNPKIFCTWIRTPSNIEHIYYYPSGITAMDEKNMNYLPALRANATKNGVAYRYYEGKFKSVDETASAKVVKEGTLNNFSIEGAAREDGFAYEFRTLIKIPEKGVYRFYTNSDDGSKLFIDGNLIVNNDGSHELQRVTETVALEAGFHELRVLYFEDYMGQELQVGFYNKNIPEGPIPDNLLFIPNNASQELNVKKTK